jgi:ABC-type iron transport system FetAB permease component
VDDFLWWIGLYNALGSLLLMAMSDVRVAGWVLRKGTEMVAEPYEHGRFGKLWLWWAATTNLFMGAVMVLASRWEVAAQREVTIAAVVAYAIMYGVILVGGRKPPWGRGVASLHVLWPAQMAWGLWALFAAG